MRLSGFSGFSGFSSFSALLGFPCFFDFSAFFVFLRKKQKIAGEIPAGGGYIPKRMRIHFLKIFNDFLHAHCYADKKHNSVHYIHNNIQYVLKNILRNIFYDIPRMPCYFQEI